MYKTLSAPVLVNWEVTQFCNHNCIHCYNYWREDEVKQRLPENYEELYGLVTEEIVKNNIFTVVITGGEPLVVIKELIPFIKNLRDNGIWLTMNSNLSLLTHKGAKDLKDFGIKSILVSLPSFDPETCDRITNSKGSLQSILRGIKIAKEIGFPIFTNMVVSRINKDQVIKTAKFIASIGLKHFSATRAASPSFKKGFDKYLLNNEEFREMQKNLEKARKKFNLKVNSLEANPVCSYGNIKPSQGYKFCTAGKTVCTIGSNGDLRPCNRSAMIYGNISNGLKNSWLGMDDWRSNKWIPKECSSCKIKYSCMGGCKVDAIISYKNPKKPDPLCDFHFVVKDTFYNKPEITKRKKFAINPRLKMRPEDFGAILFVPPNNCVSIEARLLKLFLNGANTITSKMIGDSLNVNNNEASKTLTFLMQKQILF